MLCRHARSGGPESPSASSGFGCAPLGDLYELLDDDVALRAIATAADAGVTLFDVAPLYGHGLAEHRLGTVLKRWPRDSFVLSTKVGRWLKPAPGGRDDDARAIAAGSRSTWWSTIPMTARCARSSSRCSGSRVPRIDIALIHDVDVWTHGRTQIEAALPRSDGRRLSGAR